MITAAAKGSAVSVLRRLSAERKGHWQQLCAYLDTALPELERYEFKIGDCPIV